MRTLHWAVLPPWLWPELGRAPASPAGPWRYLARLEVTTLALLLASALLTTGCVTLAPYPGGSGRQGPRALWSSHPTPSFPEAGEQEPLFSSEADEPGRAHRRLNALGPGSASGSIALQGPPACGDQAMPPGWPDFSSSREELLAPFLTCTSPAEFIALQQHVDMPRLVEALDDWRAVRLGAQGPVREDAASLLNLKRTSLLVDGAERYGPLAAEVLAVFIVDTAHDNELREILFLLARDKRLAPTLAQLPSFQAALENRGLKPRARVDRDFQVGDLGRGLAQAGKDALSTIPVLAEMPAVNLLFIRGQLPPQYQQALQEAERQAMERHFSAGHMALGIFDHATFGVPLGFYGLVAGTGHGAWALSQGEYEQAIRELAPAALLVAVYAGGKGARYLSETRGAAGAGTLSNALSAVELRARGLGEVARRLEAVLGVEGMRELARDIRASREAGRFVAVGGMDAALALREARGNVAQAQAMMSRARPGAAGSSTGSGARKGSGQVATGTAERPGTLASLVDEGVGHTREVVEAKLAAVELEATGPRFPKEVDLLERHRPALDAPPPGARGNPRWREYVDYYEQRLGEMKKGEAAEGPLKWEGYERLRGWFARGLAFERHMVQFLQEDAKKPRSQRRFLGDFERPRIETHVGVRKPGHGLRYADVLVIEEGAPGGRPRRVETFSFKSRDLSGSRRDALTAQMIEDANEALRKYGETLDIRRDSLQSHLPEGSKLQVSRVRLIYEGGNLKPRNAADLDAAVKETRKEAPGVEVSFQ